MSAWQEDAVALAARFALALLTFAPFALYLIGWWPA